MTLQEMLARRGETPKRTAKIRKGSPKLKALYKFVVAHYDEIEVSQENGYTWTQIALALDEIAQREGHTERYGMSELSAMFSFARKEREIKGVEICSN